MNWKNVNLKDQYEREQNIIDPLDFDTLLLEIHCNCKDITADAIMKQFETDLRCKVDTARSIMRDNLQNILKEAQRERSIS